MKKMMVVVMCAALALTFTACGSSSSEGETAITDETVEETEEAEEEESKLVTTNFKGISFSYPENCEYEESEEYATITIVPGEKAVTIMAQDESDLGDTADVMFELANTAILNGMDDVQDREDYDTTLAGMDAKGTTAVVTSSDLTINYTITTIYEESTKYIYSICYMATLDADDDDTIYLDLLDSMSVKPGEAADTEEETAADESIPSEYQAALNRAESYSERMHMSKQGIYDQLTSEYGDQFNEDAAQYAVDNMVADWNANALETAKSYSDSMHMSKQGIYDQLTSEYGEQFTADEAQYAVDNVDADWNANALEKAKDYRDRMDMSESAIHDQLTSEYGEKFTEEEADYAIANLN